METLLAGQQLNVNDQLVSANGRVRCTLQGDGNLVLVRTDTTQALWASNTSGKPVNHAVMQGDGNLVAYSASGNAYWGSRTWGHPGASVTLQSDGNLVLYGPEGRALWASDTVIDWNVVTIPPQRHDLGNGHVMIADAELNMQTRLVTFHLGEICTNKIFGFTGGVKLFYYDQHGKLLGDSGTLQYGINQAPLFGANHRNETWNGQAPLGTAALGLATFADPHNRFPLLGDIGKAIGSFFGDLGDVAEDIGVAVGNFCRANPYVCDATLFVVVAGAVLLLGSGKPGVGFSQGQPVVVISGSN